MPNSDHGDYHHLHHHNHHHHHHHHHHQQQQQQQQQQHPQQKCLSPHQSKMIVMPRAQSHPTDVPSRPYSYGMHMPSYPSRRAIGIRSGSVASSGGRTHLSSESSIGSDISDSSSSSPSSSGSFGVVHTKPSSRNWWCSSCRRPREECECLCSIS
ncbi:probable serine/threonine-protein kinase DDB_G0282963 [Palaemon carinicauda]|uniref:probable serine/threonine-protein kinase DDB_G0282963 n=1 Tax=Palaemon carinicauda TaxID=392227 RepID=UPI0035B625FC